MCESMFDPQQTVIAEGSVIAQDGAPVAAREVYWGWYPIPHEKTKLVRSCVTRCLACVGDHTGRSGRFRRVASSNGPEGRRKGRGLATHGSARKATRMVGRKIIAIEKAALVGDDLGAARPVAWK